MVAVALRDLPRPLTPLQQRFVAAPRRVQEKFLDEVVALAVVMPLSDAIQKCEAALLPLAKFLRPPRLPL